MSNSHLDSSLQLRNINIYDNATVSSSNLTASEWAAQKWYPTMFLSIIISMLTHFIIAYEHTLHAPMEWNIWSRILRRKKLTKAILPWSTLWLRYTTLALGIVSIVFMWDDGQSAATCRHHIIPLLMAFSCIVSCSTGCIAARRSYTIAKAAMTNTLSVAGVKLGLFFCLLLRLSCEIVAFGMQIKITNAISDQVLSQGSFYSVHLSCYASNLVVLEQSKEKGLSVLKPDLAYIGLVAICFFTDMVFAAVTFISIAKLSKTVSTQNSLLSEVLQNSIMFYALLAIVDLFTLIFYSITRQHNVVMLMIAAASILMIRVLVKEQECVSAHSQVDQTNFTKTPWFTITKDRERPVVNNRNQQNLSQAGAIAPSRAIFSLPSPNKAKPMMGGGGLAGKRRGGKGGNCPGCKQSARGVQRRGAGLTDIEKVSVLEHGRSADRPWPMWDDDEGDEEEGEEGVEQTRQRHFDPNYNSNTSHYGGLRALVANWTRGIEAAIASSEEEEQEEEIQVVRSNVEGPRKENNPSSTGDDSKSVLTSNQELSAIPSLNTLPCPPPARLNRSRSSSIQLGLQRRLEGTGPTKTMF